MIQAGENTSLLLLTQCGRIVLEDHLEGCQPSVLDVVVLTLQELAHMLKSSMKKMFTTVQLSHSDDTLEYKSLADHFLAASLLEALFNHCLHLLAKLTIFVDTLAEVPEQPEDIHLQPGGIHAVVGVLSGQLAGLHLGQDLDHTSHHRGGGGGSGGGGGRKHAGEDLNGRGYHARVGVGEAGHDTSTNLWKQGRVDITKPMEDYESLLPDEDARVVR